MAFEIIVKNKRCSLEKLKREYPDAIILDVTSKGEGEWQKLSPFYPHGGIPVPFSEGVTSMSVEGIWQGLKVFETSDIDFGSFRNSTMKGIKRTVRTNGTCLGHRKGTRGELIGYLTARRLIYLPSYNWMLEIKCKEQILKLKEMAKERTVILLDYNTNGDVNNPRKPLSHAALIREFILSKA